MWKIIISFLYNKIVRRRKIRKLWKNYYTPRPGNQAELNKAIELAHQRLEHEPPLTHTSTGPTAGALAEERARKRMEEDDG